MIASFPGDGKPRYIGVDLHKKIAAFHILSQDGHTLQSGRFDVTPEDIKRFADEHLLATDHLAVEVTSNTWAFVRLIKPYVAKVVVSNPMKTKAIAEANVKTDKVDAFVLAQLLRCDYLPSVWVPTSDIEDNRSLAARRTGLVNERPGSVTGFTRCWRAGSFKLPREGSSPTKGLPGSNRSNSSRWIEH